MSKIVTMTCQLKNRQTIWYHMMIYVHICPTRNGVSPREEKLSGFFRWPPGPAIEPLGRWCDTKLSWPCTCPPSQSKEVAQQIDRRRGKSTNRGDVMGFLLTNQHVKIVRQIWCERLKRHQKFRSTSAANIGNCVLPAPIPDGISMSPTCDHSAILRWWHRMDFGSSSSPGWTLGSWWSCSTDSNWSKDLRCSKISKIRSGWTKSLGRWRSRISLAKIYHNLI